MPRQPPTLADRAQGYALVEYENFKDAQGAVDDMNGATVMGATVSVDWAFSKGPSRAAR